MLNKVIIGTETEYSSFDPSTNDEEAMLILSKVSSLHRGYLPNGGRMYVDTGSHIEYCTPECLDPLEATTYHHAGDGIVWRAAQKARPTINVYRINESPNINAQQAWATFGCHENYLINIKERKAIYRQLVPFLVSRIILIGSGSLESGRFLLSQRARYIERVIGPDTTCFRPIINTREEGSLNSTEYERLHLIVGDTNVSPWATLIKLGTTALVIELIEQGVCFDHLCYNNPVEEIHQLNGLTPQSSQQTGNNRWQQALSIQEECLSLVIKHGLKGLLPPWYSKITDLWGISLRAIARDWRLLIGFLDWPTKYFILEEAQRQGDMFDSVEMNWVATQYHHIDPDQSLYESIRLAQNIPRSFTARDFNKASSSPSRHLAARQRAEAVLKRQATHIDWNEVRLDGKAVKLPI